MVQRWGDLFFKLLDKNLECTRVTSLLCVASASAAVAAAASLAAAAVAASTSSAASGSGTLGQMIQNAPPSANPSNNNNSSAPAGAGQPPPQGPGAIANGSPSLGQPPTLNGNPAETPATICSVVSNPVPQVRKRTLRFLIDPLIYNSGLSPS